MRTHAASVNSPRPVTRSIIRHDLAPTQYGGYLEFEAGASALRAYELALVPGLVQTEEYAAAVIRDMRPEWWT
ncbi:Scr1 family TA system antitoxin-like transcriptional regulator [Streptomyces sp. IBSBF 2435]|uniref:Scr1 family TA system antitoxin-like transcriptional regulator n=1 Tax=Streptomyces sp. IBSBF 2435 TaxID=2903531 RepID=UPI002FDBC0F1